MFHYSSDHLSSLSRGRGLVDGGVEVECFVDDRKAFSLLGQPLLKSSDSKVGQYAKPYKAHTLAMPKTYITRRGQMVLFTSPDDMLFGKSCQLHQRACIETAAEELATTQNLVTSALNYATPTDFESSTAGQFTNVYLQSLQRAVQQAKVEADVCTVEDIEKAEDRHAGSDSVLPMVSECDSGLGHSLPPSSGRLSQLSEDHPAIISEDSPTHPTIINIPDARESIMPVESAEVVPTPPSDLSLLKKELSTYLKTAPGKPVGAGRAKRKASKRKQNSKQPPPLKEQKTSQSSNKENSFGDSKHKSKNKRKKVAKKPRKANTSSSTKMEEEPLEWEAEHTLQVTAIQLGVQSTLEQSPVVESTLDKQRTGSVVESPLETQRTGSVVESPLETQRRGSVVESPLETQRRGSVVESPLETQRRGSVIESTLETQRRGSVIESPLDEQRRGSVVERERRPSRAEERRIEVERKRAEKRELELAKKQAEEEKERLQFELARQSLEEFEQHVTVIEDSDHASELSQSSVEESPIPQAVAPEVCVAPTRSLLADLEQTKLRERRLMLSYSAEKVDSELDRDILAAQEALRRAQEAKEDELKRREVETAERQRLQMEALTRRAVLEKGDRLRQEQNKQMHFDLSSQRHHQSKSFMFSYFKFVPPSKPKPEVKGRRGKPRNTPR